MTVPSDAPIAAAVSETDKSAKNLRTTTSRQYEYDPTTCGVTSIADPNGNTTTKTYNSAGDVLTSTDALNHTTTYTYDALNDVTSVTDPNGTTTTSTYDGAGNLLSVSTPLAGTNQTQTETYTYGDGSIPGT